MTHYESRSGPHAEIPGDHGRKRVRKRRKRERSKAKGLMERLSRRLTVAIVMGIWLLLALYVVFKLIMYEAQPAIP